MTQEVFIVQYKFTGDEKLKKMKMTKSQILKHPSRRFFCIRKEDGSYIKDYGNTKFNWRDFEKTNYY